MSGFYPVLGLLAVAVCISFAEGAAFPSILRDESSVNELHISNFDRPLLAEKRNVAQARSFNKKSKHASFSGDKEEQNAGVNFAYSNLANDIGEVRNLRTADANALRREAAAAGGASGNIEDESTQHSGLLRTVGRNQEDESDSSSYEESQDKSTDNQSGSNSFASAVSESEENCDDSEEETHSTETASSAATSSPISDPTEQTVDTNTDPPTSPDTTQKGSDEECEETKEPPSENSSESSIPSLSTETEEPENPSSEECEETGKLSTPATSPKPRTTTSPKKPPRKPSTPATSPETRTTTSPKKPPRTKPEDTSSGNFQDTDEEGLTFSDSNSEESLGESTNLSDWQ